MATEAELAWFRRDLSSHWIADKNSSPSTTASSETPDQLDDAAIAEAIKNKDIKRLREILTAKGDTAWDDVWYAPLFTARFLTDGAPTLLCQEIGFHAMGRWSNPAFV
jgi:hypothetical protein